MSKITLPENYQSLLGLYDTQKAIGLIKTIFQEKICMALHLKRVQPLPVRQQGSGLNDDLNGVERPVAFDVPCLNQEAEVVHSLAKWKRYALYKYGSGPGQGLVTDMNAIRRDEELDNLHSIYVDQWDWEKVISREDRNEQYLRQTVPRHCRRGGRDERRAQIAFPSLHTKLEREVYFVTTQELEDRWPDYTPKEREDAICREHRTVFLMQIGDNLKRSGQAPRRPRPRLRRLELERRHSHVERGAAAFV